MPWFNVTVYASLEFCHAAIDSGSIEGLEIAENAGWALFEDCVWISGVSAVDKAALQGLVDKGVGVSRVVIEDCNGTEDDTFEIPMKAVS